MENVKKIQCGSSDWPQMVAKAITKVFFAQSSGKERLSLVVPGGRTAEVVLPLLAAMNLPWERIDITLTDERWVATGSPDSNEYLVRRALLDNGAGAATFIGLKTDHPTPRDGIGEIERRLASITRPFDVVFLGMGDDGHIASLFPGQDEDFSKGAVCAVSRPDFDRISMTPTTILDSKLVVLAISGKKKCETFEKAQREGDARKYPVLHVLNQQTTNVRVLLTQEGA